MNDNKTLENHLLNKEKNLNVEILEIQNEQRPSVKIKDRILRQRGILYALSAAFFISLSGTITKYCYYFNGSEITTVRYLIQLIIMFIIGVYRKENLLGESGQRKILFLRAAFGTVGLLLITISYKMIDPSDSISLVNCSILIVAILSRLILKEKLTLCHLVALTMTSIGVVLISQPSFLIPKKVKINKNNMSIFNETIQLDEKEHFDRILGISFALIGALCAATVSILLKKLANKKVHYSIAVIYASYLGLPICSVISFILLYTGKEKKPEVDTITLLSQSILTLLSSLSGLFSQVCMNLAFLYEDVTKVSLVRSTDLLFSFILQYFLLDIHSNLYSITGALLILTSVTMVMIYKIMDQKYVKKHKDYLESKKLKLNKSDQNAEENSSGENIVKPSAFKKILFYKF